MATSYSLISGQDQQKPLEEASAEEVLLVTLVNTVLILGAAAIFAPLPGTSNRGGFYPVFIPEHWSSRVSAYPFDPYTINHVNHGVLFYLLALALGSDMSKALVVTLASAMAWEVWENSDYVINKFRQYEGPSEFYEGDSKINSAFDVLSCGLGFAGALLASSVVGPWPQLVYLLGTEMLMGLVWRDNVLLQMIQLSAYSPAIAAWQLEVVPKTYRSPSKLMRTILPPDRAWRDGRGHLHYMTESRRARMEGRDGGSALVFQW